MVTKKEKFSKKSLVNIVNNKKIESISFEDYFKKLILNFIEEKRGSFDIVEIVVLACTLLEGVIKEKLKEINPALLLDKIDPVVIAVVSNKQKKLLQKNRNISIKTSGLRVLLDRYSLFFDIDKYKNGIKYLITVRNNIVHNNENCDINLLQLDANLCKYIFPFLEKNIAVQNTLWDSFNRISELVDDRYIRQIMKEVVRCNRYYEGLSEFQKEEKLKIKFKDTSDEFARVRDLFCPACKNASMTLVDGVDFDYAGGGEYDTHSYYFASCSACGLYLESPEIDAILENSANFFNNDTSVRDNF
jgi:hypothetical protein